MKEFEKWIKKADGDLYNVDLLLKSENCQPDICCYHAQQCAEKYIKAYLVSRQQHFPFTHDLAKLLDLCLPVNKNFEQLKITSFKLTDYAITPRYPDDIEDLTIEDAKLAYANATIIKEFILKHFFE